MQLSTIIGWFGVAESKIFIWMQRCGHWGEREASELLSVIWANEQSVQPGIEMDGAEQMYMPWYYNGQRNNVREGGRRPGLAGRCTATNNRTLIDLPYTQPHVIVLTFRHRWFRVSDHPLSFFLYLCTDSLARLAFGSFKYSMSHSGLRARFSQCSSPNNHDTRSSSRQQLANVSMSWRKISNRVIDFEVSRKDISHLISHW